MDNDILNKINSSLDNMLDKELKICYEYSSIIMVIYKELLVLSSLMDCSDISSYDQILDKLENYVLKEYDAYEKLLIYEKARLLPKIDTLINDLDSSLEQLRYRNKLQFTKNIFIGYKISARELEIENIPKDMKFDIYSVLLTVIYIDTFKKMNDKLDDLTYDDEKEAELVHSLYGELNIKLFKKCCANDLLEIISLFNGMNIDKIPNISMNVVTNYLSKMYYGMDMSEHVSEIFFNAIVADISSMSHRDQLAYTPEDILDYLYFITRMETIMLYMNRDYLLKLYEYCKGLKFDNAYISSDVKSKIKRRLSIEK